MDTSGQNQTKPEVPEEPTAKPSTPLMPRMPAGPDYWPVPPQRGPVSAESGGSPQEWAGRARVASP